MRSTFGATSVTALLALLQATGLGRAGRHARQNPRVGRERKRDTGQLVHAHPRGHGDGRHLHDVHGPLADDVAAEDSTRLAVGDQFAEAELAPVNDGARGRVEVDDRGHDIVRFAGLLLCQAHLGILRVREAPDGTHLVLESVEPWTIRLAREK